MGSSTPQARAGLVSKKQRRKGQVATASPSAAADSATDTLDGKVATKYAYTRANEGLPDCTPGATEVSASGTVVLESGESERLLTYTAYSAWR